MNDFFTELDSDLLGVTAPVNLPAKTPEKAAEVSYVPKKDTVPVSKEKAPEPRERESQEKPNNTPVPNHVDEMRSQMMKSWVVVVVFKADEKTRTLLGHLKLETRGFVYLDEVREAHKITIKKARASYEDTLRDIPDIEEKDLIKIIRRDLEVFLQNKLERTPVIIPIILYV